MASFEWKQWIAVTGASVPSNAAALERYVRAKNCGRSDKAGLDDVKRVGNNGL